MCFHPCRASTGHALQYEEGAKVTGTLIDSEPRFDICSEKHSAASNIGRIVAQTLRQKWGKQMSLKRRRKDRVRETGGGETLL